MPPTHPESTPSAKSDTSASPRKRLSFLVRICTEFKQYKPLARWVVLTLLVLSAMHAAANHFLPAAKSDQKIDGSKFKPADSKIASFLKAWWNPDIPVSDSPGSPLDSETGPKNAPNGLSAIPNQLPKTQPQQNGSSVEIQMAPIGTDGAVVQVAGGNRVGLAGGPGLPNWRGGRNAPSAPHPGTGKLTAKPDPLQTQSATVVSGSSTITQGKSIVPIDRSVQLTTSPLSGGATLDLAPLGSDPTVPFYVILGLSKTSNPSSAITSSGSLIASNATLGGDLHFSLSGQLSATPTYSIAEDSSSIVINPQTPEPATGGLLAGGAAILALRRRRAAYRGV